MFSRDDVGEKIISFSDMKVYEIKAVRHVTYESQKTYNINTYLRLDNDKWINSRDCVLLNKRKNR